MTAANDLIAEAIRKSLNGMRDEEPESLADAVDFRLRKHGLRLDSEALLAAVPLDSPNDVTRRATHFALLGWDNADPGVEWTAGSERGSADRRERIYDLLDLDEEVRNAFSKTFPTVASRDAMIVDPDHWTPWYDPEESGASSFYWRAYRGVLEGKGWDVNAISTLDRATTEIVARLADPTGEMGYQTKGLVVGHVQSGKTANFTGFIAKSIDAGYRLIIVLTGTIELLRNQTQRRLDMELVGKENILDGANPDDADAIRYIDYVGKDSDWDEGKFLEHAVDIHATKEIPSIRRLTTASKDYRRLGLGRTVLDPRGAGELHDPSKPAYHPDNIGSVNVRIAVMKKNSAALKHLIHDLSNIHTELNEIPALIIDDEADQASVNTVNRKNLAKLPKAEADDEKKQRKERTRINELIVELLDKLPRAQYVGYTATPFANVFVSPDDAKDLFPKDFILSLEPSSEYVGGRHFHDLDGVDESNAGNPAYSNQAAFVRNLLADGDADPDAERLELRGALDAFVLTGAIKKWREANVADLSFRHHTMLVHTSVRTADHSDLARTIRDIWHEAQYSEPASLPRLRELFDHDFKHVTASRPEWSDGYPLPESFDALKPFIGEALDEIGKHNDPVVEVNGSDSSDYDALDFQLQPYWRVMVGGAKLSRGFTVEGLTITFFRRRATYADTLMQMGRWFGYRPGYKDLVRLYVARDVLQGKRTYDMYEAFTAIVQDEEEFRAQLRQYAEIGDDGKPRVRPLNIPPMVFQQLPWLKPVAANRMYNAELQYEGQGGIFKDFNALGPRGDGSTNAANFEAVRPLLRSLSTAPAQFSGARKLSYLARHAIVSNDDVLAFLRLFKLMPEDRLSPTIAMIETAAAEKTLKDWAVIVPDLADTSYQRTFGDVMVTLRERSRRDEPRHGFSGSEPRHRAVIERIAMRDGESTPIGDTGESLVSPTRGALLLNFAYDPKLPARGDDEERPKPAKRAQWEAELPTSDVGTMLSLALPYASAPKGRIGFRVRREDMPDSPIVDLD